MNSRASETAEELPDGPLGAEMTTFTDMQEFFRAEVLERGLRVSLGKAHGEAEYTREVILPSAEEILRELCGKDQSLYDKQLYLTYLQLLSAHGMYAKGAQMGALLYEFLAPKLKDDVFFMRLISEAGWMHYASVGVGEDEAFGEWHKRAAALYQRMEKQRMKLDKKESISIESRKQFMIGEIKMLLMKARIAWKKGQFSKNHEQKIDLCGDAMLDCDMILIKDRHWLQEPLKDASEVEKIMHLELKDSLEYQAAIAEARRMKAMMLGLSYQLNSWSMEDAESAEITLSESEPYIETLKGSAQVLLKQYLGFYADHPELPQPRELWFAYLENIRQLKILGRHADAHAFGMRVLDNVQKSPEKQNDEIYKSRLLAFISDNQVVLAQKLGVDNSLMAQAFFILEESKVVIPQPCMAPTLAKLLFEKARNLSVFASQTGDKNSKRIARDTAAEATLSLIAFSTDRSEKIRLVREIFASFMNDGQEESRCSDNLWKFTEAPQLCRLAQHARNLGLNDIDIRRYTNGRNAYLDVLHALRAEAKKQEAVLQAGLIKQPKKRDFGEGLLAGLRRRIGIGPSEQDELRAMYLEQEKENPYLGAPIPMRYFRLVEENEKIVETYFHSG